MSSVLILAAIAGLADFLGALLALFPLRYSGRALLLLIGMSGGYLVTWSVAELIPMLIQESPGLVLWVLAGYFGLYIFENIFSHRAHPGVAEHHAHALVDSWTGHAESISKSASWAAVSGLFVHAFFDGAAIAASFAINPSVATMVCFAVLLHKLPEGSSLTSILGAAGGSNRVILSAAAVSGFLTFGGGVVAWFIGMKDPGWSYALLGLSAGTFLFIGASNLIPSTEKSGSPWAICSVLSGVLIFFGVRMFFYTVGMYPN